MPRIIFTFIALLTAIALASCGSEESSSSGPASLAPAGAAVYGEVTLDPSDDQQADIEALIEKFPGKGSAGERIRGLLEKAFAESGSGLSFEDDVEPWLGDEAGFFVSDFGGGDDVPAAALVATEDEDKAADAIAKAAKSDDGRTASYRGHDYYAIDDGAAGVVDGWVVIGSLSGFKDAIDTGEGGRRLEDDETFQKTLADAPEERLGFVYVNTPALVDNLKKSSPAASLGPFADILKDPVLATLDVNEHGARLETVLPACPPTHGSGSRRRTSARRSTSCSPRSARQPAGAA